MLYRNRENEKEKMKKQKQLLAIKDFESCVYIPYKYYWELWQILEDPSPSPSKHNFSPEFCSFTEACLQKDADARPTAEQVSI